MDEKKDNFDSVYEALIKEYDAQVDCTGNYVTNKKISATEHEVSLRELGEQVIKNHNDFRSKKSALIAAFAKEKKFNQYLINQQSLALQKKNKIKDEIDRAKILYDEQHMAFSNKMEELLRIFLEPTKTTLESSKKNVASNKQAIQNLDVQLFEYKKAIENLKKEMISEDYIIVPGYREVSDEIQRDSAKKFENPLKNQKLLAELKEHNVQLEKSIQEMKKFNNILESAPA